MNTNLFAFASGRTRREIEALVAQLAPRPDAPTSVRKLPTPTARLLPEVPPPSGPFLPVMAAEPLTPPQGAPARPPMAAPTLSSPARRAAIETTSPGRYRVQFTIGKESHDTLLRLQALLRREIPDGDAGAIVERALCLLLEKVEKAKFAGARKPRRIRPGADESRLPSEARTPAPHSRHIPAEVQRTAWRREGGQCGFIATDGKRCRERAFLEFHHVQAHAKGGPATAGNVALRCRRHNQYEAELLFGSHRRAGRMAAQ